MRPLQTQSLPLGGADALAVRRPAATRVERRRAALAEARERTLALIEPVSAENLDRVHSPLMSPLAWDLGHIAAFEDLWLCQRAGGLAPLRAELAAVYDAADTPRPGRGDVPYLRRDDVLEFMHAVRQRALAVLERLERSPEGGEQGASAFVWELLVQHEHQHNETMLQTLQLAQAGVFTPDRSAGAGEHDDRPAVAGGPARADHISATR